MVKLHAYIKRKRELTKAVFASKHRQKCRKIVHMCVIWKRVIMIEVGDAHILRVSHYMQDRYLLFKGFLGNKLQWKVEIQNSEDINVFTF